jgi:hypothetical protein
MDKETVGTVLAVLTSIGISFKSRVFFLYKKGILIPALPMSILGFLRKPEMINALSGGALTYPAASMPKIIIAINIGIKIGINTEIDIINLLFSL